MFDKLKKAVEVKTEDEGSNARMQAIFQRDRDESKGMDIRAKFDSTFIPGVHKPAEIRPPGVHGWIDNEGELHSFDPITADEIEPRSLDAWQEARLEKLEADNA